MATPGGKDLPPAEDGQARGDVGRRSFLGYRWLAVALLGALAAGVGWSLVTRDALAFRSALEERLQEAADRASATVDTHYQALDRLLADELTAGGRSLEQVLQRHATLRASGRWGPELVIVDVEGRRVSSGAAAPAEIAGRPESSRPPARSIERGLRHAGMWRRPTDEIRYLQGASRHGGRVLVGLGDTGLVAAHSWSREALSSTVGRIAVAESNSGELALTVTDANGQVTYASATPRGQPVTATSTLRTVPGWRLGATPAAATVQELVTRRERKAWLLAAICVLIVTGVTAVAPMRWAPQEPDAPVAPEPVEQDATVRVGSTIVDFECYEVRRGEERFELTEREVELLRHLVERPRVVLHRQTLLEEIWEYNPDVTTRTLDTFVYRLRQKLELDPGNPKHLITVRGVGFKFVP